MSEELFKKSKQYLEARREVYKAVDESKEQKIFYDFVKENYIKSGLLKEEIDYARGKGKIKELKAKKLTMIVGTSPEPLLQTILAYNPDEVLLLLNQSYGEDVTYSDMEDFWSMLIQNLQEQYGLKCSYEPIIVEDTADSIFINLLDNTKEERVKTEGVNAEKPLIVDITGGKKSMIAGAFLFGSYMENICMLSYVDFDFYNLEMQAPLGYSCKIDEVSSPFETMQLGLWPQIEQLYKQGAYKNCREFLYAVKDIKDNNIYCENSRQEKLEDLCELVHALELWDNNAYQQALKKIKKVQQDGEGKLEDKMPLAISKLGTIWRDGESEPILAFRTMELSGLYDNTEALKMYVNDEKLRIDRLIANKEDYRSAVMRAGALVEFILRSVFLMMVTKKEVKPLLYEIKDKINSKNKNNGRFTQEIHTQVITEKNIQSSKYKEFFREQGEEQFIWHCLIGGAISRSDLVAFFGKTGVYKGIDILGTCYLDALAREERFLLNTKANKCNNSYKKWSKFINRMRTDADDLKDIRDRTTHTCLPVSKQNALDAKNTVNSYYEEFSRWLSDNGAGKIDKQRMSPPVFSELCKILAIDFLPLNK